jgi:hypothetical protein
MKRLVHQPTTPGQGIVCGVEPKGKSQIDFWLFFSPTKNGEMFLSGLLNIINIPSSQEYK